MVENGVPTVAQVLGWSASTAIRMAKRYGRIRPDVQLAGFGEHRNRLALWKSARFEGGVHQNGNQVSAFTESGRWVNQLILKD
jgi:hypothetical protein